MELSCPCGLGRPYSDCCGRLHAGERAAATAEELMRSRYAAYSRGEVDYLVRTVHPSKRQPDDRASLTLSVKQFGWTGLTILATELGQPSDTTGVVEFEAHYVTSERPGVMHERSRFVKEAGVWFYVEGEVADQDGPQSRKALCACGSGKKFKRCCGATTRA